MASERRRSRTYDSPLRRRQAQATRVAILTAAQRLFAERGYAGTSIAALAAEAEVAEKTVYLAFETKAGLLRAVWNHALRGGDDETPVAEQRWFREVIEEPDPERALRLNARNSRVFKERATSLLRAVRDAAPQEPEIGELWDRIQAEYRANQLAVVESLGKGALRRGLGADRAADVIWSLNHPNTWLQLVELRGWSAAEYERWVAETSCEQLLGGRASRAGSVSRAGPGD